MMRNKRGFTTKAGIFVFASLALLASTPFLTPVAARQATAPTSSFDDPNSKSPGSASIATNAVPDVQIVISPDMTSGKWIVAAVYPGQVVKTKAIERAKDLLSLSGWKEEGLSFENQAVHSGDGGKAYPTMSSVSFGTVDNLVDWQSGTMDLEPLIRAYRDLSRIQILYMVPSGFQFHGLRQYSDANVDINQSGNQGAFMYVVLVKNHQMNALNLPRTQDAEKVREASTAKKASASSGRILFVVVLAALAATIAFLSVRHLHARQL